MTPTPHIITKKNKPAKRGFALVLAIMLMSFMVLLIISLASLVQLQLRMSRQAINENKAKQAAKFAAYQAMSEIQRSMGPDTRITANAKMFDDTIVSDITSLDTKGDYDWWTSPMNITRDDANEIADQGISQNRYWVGVWDARNGYAPDKQTKNTSRREYVRNTTEKALTWLVSGNKIRDIYDEKASSIKYLPSQKLSSGSFVRAVSSGSAASESGTAIPDYDVMVPLVTLDKDPNALTGEVISDGKQTRIAWWVSDESQKASLNAVASREEIQFAERVKYRLQSLPFYSGIHGLTVPKLGGNAGTNAFDFTFEDTDETSDLEIIRNLEDVKVLDVYKSSQVPDSIQIGKVFFHDVTFNTKGVLVNTREGGLKKDLSVGLLRKDYDNEEEELDKTETTTMPEYFEQPFGVAGFKFKSSAYPLVDIDVNNSFQRFVPDRMSSSNAKNRNLNQRGHMFGPQMFGREKDTDKFDNMSIPQSATKAMQDIYSDNLIFKDPGGPLWDQLRSYYNFRADDNINNNTLSSRVQTDDRWGFKPIVKRFQVFYVPSFVEYSQKRYGLRLHIIPLLILWNPYDVKIDGDTYYAIRLYGSEYTGPGKFRFAIGYKSGNYFQCARDLRTEFMPSVREDIFAVLGQGGNANYKYKNNADYDIRGLYMAQNNAYSEWTSSRDGAYNKFVSRFTPFSSNENYPGLSVNNGLGDAYRQGILPLGYGELPNLSVMTVSGNNGWQSIVENSNIYPAYSEAQQSIVHNKALPMRVAKVPLYLNNLLVDLNHGTWKTMDRNRVSQNTYFVFRGQRNITAYSPKNADPLDGNPTNLQAFEDISYSSDIHFLAYDKNGIEPGEGKIFAMERIVNYFGDLGTSSNTNGTIGPNGDVEGDGNTSEYTRKKALMKGLDEGGVLGGCFYVDVPHPEAVHAYKYNTDRTSAKPYEMGLGTNTNILDAKGKFSTYTKNDADVVLDLNLIDAYGDGNDLLDVNNQRPPSEIGSYMIDMQDVCMTASHQGTWDVMNTGDSKPINTARPAQTPMGYYFYAFTPEGEYTTRSWRKFQHRFSRYYSVMNATIWIWQREGFSFSKYSNKNSFGILPGSYGNYEDRYKWDPRIDLSPVLAQLEGYRIFTGDTEPSFPDPTLQFERHKNAAFNFDLEVYSPTNQYRVNYYQPGRSPRQQRLYFKPLLVQSKEFPVNNRTYAYDVYPDDHLESDTYIHGNNINKTMELEESFSDDTYASDPYMRARYYINWLGVSSKRHSANYWNMYQNKDFTPQMDFSHIDNMVDMNPQSIGGEGNSDQVLVVTYSTSPNYHNELNQIAETKKGAPYGFIFMQPYANNGSGLNPFYNRRLFVNGSLQATYYGMDYNTIDMTSDTQSKSGTKFGSLPKYMLGASQAYGNHNAYSVLGYKVERKPGNNKPYVGLDYQSGATSTPLHHVLRKTEVVHNPANLAGVTLTFGAGKASLDRTDGSDRHFYKSWGLNVPETMMQGSNAIGNSLAPSRMSPMRSYHITWLDGKENSVPYDLRNYKEYGMEAGEYDGKRDKTWKEDRGVIYDMSWHLNNVLWDEYFFSTLPYRNDEFKEKMDSDFVMPQNPRLRYYVSEDSVDEDLHRLTDTDLHSSSSNEDQFTRNAALFWINGPFNVNSTSVDAWKVVLSTYYGQMIEGYKSGTENIANETPMHRWAAPLEGKAMKEGGSIREDNAMTGYRSLNNEEIEELAVAIVEHIKDRGPFYSMSHFVNRVVTNYSAEERFTDQFSDDKMLPTPAQYDDRKNLEAEYNGGGDNPPRMNHMQKGVLQAAIDSTSINSEWHKDPDFIITKTERNKSDEFSDPNFENTVDASKTWENWRAAIGPQGTGAPTYLMQQDILARIGSFLTVRSDTFKIRAYGEIRNPISGAVEGKAWCEMTVQRTPEYFDTETNDQDPWNIHNREPEMGAQPSLSYKGISYDEYIKDQLSSVNQELGRRFKVVGFRWLNEKEI